MSKSIRMLVLFALLAASACGKAPTKPSTTGNVERATPQIIAGFQPLPTAPMVSAPAPTDPLPTATPVVLTQTQVVTQTVVVPQTQVIRQTVVVVPPTPTLLPTWTPTPPFVATFAPPATPSALGDNCDNPGTQITYPRQNETVRWSVTMPVTGTANIPNFLYWKVQYEPEATFLDPVKHDIGWGELYRNEKDIKRIASPQPTGANAHLMDWQTRTVDPGVYYIRLVVNRLDGSYPEPCTVRVVIAPY